jgi:hypothetical protein
MLVWLQQPLQFVVQNTALLQYLCYRGAQALSGGSGAGRGRSGVQRRTRAAYRRHADAGAVSIAGEAPCSVAIGWYGAVFHSPSLVTLLLLVSW